jgi:hypothetical protein
MIKKLMASYNHNIIKPVFYIISTLLLKASYNNKKVNKNKAERQGFIQTNV